MTEALFTKSEDLWNPYRDLKGIVWKHLNEISDDIPSVELENTLRKHKQSFFSLLQNPPKNAKSREELKKGMVDGITVKGIGHQILSKELYHEAITLSDMFDINEFVALDLLCTAQIQMPYYPCLPRGLVAVLLYYDGRKALVSTLLYLVQARKGVQWSVKVKPDIERFITDYTEQLMEGGLFDRIFELLRKLDLSKEMDLLQQNLALGGPKHRRQVTDLFNDIRSTLANVVFTWSAQSGLPKDVTVSLINYLREAKIEEEASGKLDDVNLYLLMGLLYALDLSILHTREDGEEAVQSLPILSVCNQSFIDAIIHEFEPKKPRWACEGLEAVSTFCLSVCLASLRVVPHNYLFQDAINKEESFVDAAIEMNCFDFMHSNLLECEALYKEEFLYKRIHNLLSDFIVYMYPKIKELRLKADEIARTMQVYMREGLEAPPNLPRYFENLLLTVGKFYSKDILDTEYKLSYWSPYEINPTSQGYSSRPPPRAVSLFKFIRLAGDMLPMTLFVPYLSMLTGLSSSQPTARHCFNMLKQVGTHLPSTLSWDHFFLSFAQYYTNLRQEAPPVTDTVYRNRAATFHKGVSPQELDGLHSVLLLIRTIAENDEFSRLALCEHPGWSPLTVLLGLVSCSVPQALKADLLLTLAALSKSSENAFQMWENLEASQILRTIPSTSSYEPRGLQTELDEIESRMEEYPLTRAILGLLDTLTDFGIPRTLGAGPRKPGFDPYLNFIINSVFLKFHTRSYRNASEKWQVAKLCLNLFGKFLNQYDPRISDFPNNATIKEFNSPPGFHLMLNLNTKSEMLNVLLDIINEGNRLFDSYVAFPGQKLVQECTLSCLKIIQRTLALQPKFFSVLASSNSSVILTSISKLLLTINRRSGKPDHCVNIAKYVSYQFYMPNHSQIAVKILTNITGSPVSHNQFFNILMSCEDSKKIIKTGFVECLDSTDEDDEEVNTTTKIEILKLLKQCLGYNAPNFSHFLFGFDLKRDISKTEFQFPGVMDFPRSCLHSLLSILENVGCIPSESSAGALLESTYHTLYLLASNGKTSGPVLRFVRCNKNFFRDHLRETYRTIDGSLHEFNQFSWLMKTLAIELKVSTTTKQVTYLKQLTSFLVNIPSEDMSPQDAFSLLHKSVAESRMVSSEEMKMSNFMTSLIQRFEFNYPEIETPSWEFFDTSALNAILESCQSKSTPKMIDLKKLHQILYEELKTFQGTAVMGQIQAISQEIPKVLKYALELNKRSEQRTSMFQFVNGWRQVIEVLVVYMPEEVLSTSEQQLVCICVLSNLLKDIAKLQLLPEVSRVLSGTVLLMVDTLKNCYTREQKLLRFIISDDEATVNVLQVYSGILKDVLENLVEWIMVSSVVDGELRINLYAALVTFLQFASSNQEGKNDDLVANNSTYVSALDSSRFCVMDFDIQSKLQLDTFSGFGGKLIEILCHDCDGGQEICKILAMSSFSHLMTLSGNINWILHMSGKGYLKHIIQSLLDSDTDLRNMLEPNPESIKPLYLYLAKILLLARLAATRVGAELLLEQKLLACFSNMTVFSLHPEISKNWQITDILDDFMPSVETQYLQIWMPTLDICNIILTTLGTENRSAVVQIMYFLLSHLDVMELILRSGHPDLSSTSLKELALLTSVLSRTANNDLINILENPNIVHNNRAQLYRIQKLLLALVPKFVLSEDTVKRLMSQSTQSKSSIFETSDRLLYAMQIMSNLLCYARNIVANNGIEHGGVGVIFTPTLCDPLLTTFNNRKNFTNPNQDQEQSLGVIVQQLICTVNYQHQEKVNCDILAKKLNEIPDMNTGDLKQFINDSAELYDLVVMREKAYEIISDRLEKKKTEMEYCSFIIENVLYLIWAHLDYYMLKAIPKSKAYGYIHSNSSLVADNTLAPASEAAWKVSTDAISDLKQGLVSLFNDSFSKQLVETTQGHSVSDVGLVEALLRKIKRLIQFVPVK